MSKAWGVLCVWLLAGLLVACGGSGVDDRKVGADDLGDRKSALAASPSVANFESNGWFWNPAESGTGFMFEAQGNRGFVAFFMYEEGSGKPIWYASTGGAGSFVANADGSYRYSGELRVYSGGQPAWSSAYVSPSSRPIGEVTIVFVGRQAAVRLPNRTIAATRFDFSGLGSAPNARQPELGWYWNPAEGGRGYALEVQNDRLFMAIFHYTDDGAPTWNVVETDLPDGTASGTFALYADGQTLDSGFRHAKRHEVGSYRLSFRNPCAGQVQLAGAPAVSVRRFVFGDLPAGSECRSASAATEDRVPGVEAGPVRLQPGDSVFGRIDQDGDIDAHGIALKAGVSYRFDLLGAGSAAGTLSDPRLALYDAKLEKLAENNNRASGERESRIDYTPRTSGIYYLAAQANGIGTGSYLLAATGVAADLDAQAPWPPALYAGRIDVVLTGRDTGAAELVVDTAGRVAGTVRPARDGGTVLAVSGTLSVGGVLGYTAGSGAEQLGFTGILSPQGRLWGTWSDASGPGGLQLGRSDMAPPVLPTLVVRARATLAGGVGPTLVLRVDGVVAGSVVVDSLEPTDYRFTAAALRPGARVDLAFTDDARIDDADRNLFILYLSDGRTTLLPTAPGAVLDHGSNDKAFDGLDVTAGRGELYSNSALRLTWPTESAASPDRSRQFQAVRLLQQATFGPTPAEIERLAAIGDAAWLDEQLALPASADYVAMVQQRYSQGSAYRPGGSNYEPTAIVRRFWAAAANGPDQLRQRTAFALHHIFMVSMEDSNLWEHSRAYAHYLDTLNRQAFGNFRSLLEDIALSPVMGIYLSHMRNRREDPAANRLPDENFAREVMQLFTIGLVELNRDGSPRLGADGRTIETYGNADVMAMAKVFTGWSWAFPDAELSERNFRWGSPKYSVGADAQIDLLPMKPYPGQHSTAAKPLFAGRPAALLIPENTPARDSLRLALDALFNHPNVGPFIGRQLIQRLTTSNPSPAYVARVAGVFDNNGRGVRGDLGAVVRAILLDPEARQAPAADFGKLREPVLRVSHWMRAFGARSATGNHEMVWDLDALLQRPFHATSVFGYFRPGYVPPNSTLSATGATAPELQIVNESSAPAWLNLAENLAGDGLGWTGSARDVSATLEAQIALSASGMPDMLIRNLDLLLFAGQMPASLRQDILDAVAGVGGNDANGHRYRARVALLVALASPEFLVQR